MSGIIRTPGLVRALTLTLWVNYGITEICKSNIGRDSRNKFEVFRSRIGLQNPKC